MSPATAELIINARYPRGPFWPHAPPRNNLLRSTVRDLGELNVVLAAVGLADEQFLSLQLDANGQPWAINLLTQFGVPLSSLGF
jgi:hypothetical protein